MMMLLPAGDLGNHTINHRERRFLLVASGLLHLVFRHRCRETGDVEDELEQIHRLLFRVLKKKEKEKLGAATRPGEEIRGGCYCFALLVEETQRLRGFGERET